MRNSAIRKGKIRLLAGIMASLLLSTACLSGVRAAGTEDHTALHASDGGWKATAEAGETPFPEGAALHIAAGDDTTVAEVRKSIESMDQEESALKSLNVYEISLSDGDGEPLDYDDEITLTVTDENAVQQDLDDEISCVIYPITEDGESENGLSVGEPVTADAVKLSDAGELAEFTVKTGLTGKIAAAVYTASDGEPEEQKDEINTLALDDGETEGNENTDIGISTFAVNTDGEIKLPPLQQIDKDSYSPLNNLQIVDNIEGAKVEVIARENGNGVFNWHIIEDGAGLDESPNDSMYVGEFYGINGSGWAYGIDKYIYESMRGGENDKKFGAVSVQFKSSVEGYRYEVDPKTGAITDKITGDDVSNDEGPCNIFDNPPDDYRRDYKAGWKEDDLNLGNTTMKVTLRYTNAGYYKGKLIDAEAEIRITPSKNKNQTSNEEQLKVGGYCGIYYPMFQASGSLYRGWVWQNVEQFHVELTFYEKDSDTPIALGSSNASSAGDNQSIGAMNADYYVINSLNPALQIETTEKPTVYVGPEYVLPTHEIANAYKVGKYTGSDGTSYSSNIQEQYDSGQATQYAYNGGIKEWDSDDDSKPGWAQNSVMIMPKAGTTKLGFTMGNMSRIPPASDATATQATHLMWASISTTPYTKEYQPINIYVEKTWQGITDLTGIKSIDLKLYGEYLDAETQGTKQLDLDRQITITQDNDGNWKGIFNFVPGKDFLKKNNYDNEFRYVVRETEITYTDGTSKTPEIAGFKLGGTTAISLELIPDDASGTIDRKFALTNIMPGLTIIKKGIDSDGKEKPLEKVEFQLQKANENFEPVTGGIPQSASTDTDGKLVFSNLAEGNYLLTETKTLPGYTLLKEPVKITIPYTVEASPDTGISYVASKDIVGVTEGNKTKYYNLTYTITNGQSFDMPQTGGTTTGRFMRCGAVLSVTAAGVLLCQRAGRRRWGRKADKVFKLHTESNRETTVKEKKMRKKNLFKKLIAAAGAMAMALTLMVPMGVSAAPTMDSTTPVNLIIEKHKTPSEGHNQDSTGEKLESVTGDALAGVEFTIVKVAEIDANSYEVKYKLTADGAAMFSSLGESEGAEVTGSALQKCLEPTSGNDLSAIKDCTNYISGKTAVNGQVVFSSNNTCPSECEDSTLVDMTTGRGIYLVVETAWPATVTERSVPFLVSLPMTSKKDNGSWIYDVYAYPKNSTEDFKIDKNITSVGDPDGNISEDKSKAEASIGDVITYQVPVTAVIPDGGLKNLGIKDTMSKGLTLINDSNVEVNVTESEAEVTGVVDVYEGTTTDGTELTEGTDYTVMASKGSDGNTILKVKLSDSKVKELNDEAASNKTPRFLFVYKAKLNENAVAGSETTGNSVKLVYEYTNNPGQEIEFGTKIDTTIYNWGIDITKQSDIDEKLSGVTFELYKDKAEGTALKFRQINGGENNGVYYLDTAGDSTLTTSGGGKLVIHGLASGTYYLKETKTNSGYVLLKDPVKIVISPDSDFNGETNATIGDNESTVNQNGNARFAVTVVNNKGFDLPQTGAAGTALFAVAGMAIAAVAGGLLFFLRRSSKK